MTTLHGYTDGSYDYRQMYNIKDIKGPLPTQIIRENTLLKALNDNPKCAEFARIIMSLPDMAARFNSSQANFTVFVPISELCIRTNDQYKNRQFILLHTLEHAYPYTFISSMSMSLLDSRLPGTKILIENLGTPYPVLNRQSQILGSQIVGNAIIYYIDKSLCLDGNPLTNVDI